MALGTSGYFLLFGGESAIGIPLAESWLQDTLLDVGKFLGAHLREMGKVEAHPLGLNKRTGLLDMCAEIFSKRGLQEVRGERVPKLMGMDPLEEPRGARFASTHGSSILDADAGVGGAGH